MEQLLKEIVYTVDESGNKVVDTAGCFDFTPYIRSYQTEYADMDASIERTAGGRSVRDYIRTVITIKCTFKTVDRDDAVKLMERLKKKELIIAYFDGEKGTYSEEEADLISVYPSLTRSSSLYGTVPDVMYNETAIDFIEF